MAKAGTQGKWQDGMVEKRAVAKTSAQQIAQQSEELSRLETVNHWVVEKQNGGAIALAERLARHYHVALDSTNLLTRNELLIGVSERLEKKLHEWNVPVKFDPARPDFLSLNFDKMGEAKYNEVMLILAEHAMQVALEEAMGSYAKELCEHMDSKTVTLGQKIVLAKNINELLGKKLALEGNFATDSLVKAIEKQYPERGAFLDALKSRMQANYPLESLKIPVKDHHQKRDGTVLQQVGGVANWYGKELLDISEAYWKATGIQDTVALMEHYHTEFEKALLDSARGGFQSIPELSKGVKSHTNEELAKKAPTKHVATR